MDFSAALAPAASGSKLTTTFWVWRLRIATCCSVKAVPLVAITFWMPAQKDADAVHLAFDEQRKTYGADRGPRLVEIEEHLPFRVERRLRRVDVLRPGFFAVSSVRARGEGDDAPALVRDGKDDALAETVVERPWPPSSCSFELKRPLARRVASSARPLRRSRRALKLSGAYPMRNFLMPSSESPRPARYSRASAPSGERNCSSNHAAAVSCRSRSFALWRASAASSGEENSRLGSGMPHFCATIADGFGEGDVFDFADKAKIHRRKRRSRNSGRTGAPHGR